MLKIKLIFILGFLLLLTACGRKVVNKKLPENETSPLVSNQIDEALKMFEQDFKESGILINLHRLPVIVGKIKNRGECHYDKNNKPRAIVLNRNLFPSKDSALIEATFVQVLLHEIGHCYFDRQHKKTSGISTNGKTIALPTEAYVPGWGADRVIIHDKGLAVSIMETPFKSILPKALRKYYVAELAGKDKARTIEDLKKYTDYDVLEDGRWFPRMKEIILNEGEVKTLYPCSVADLLPLTDEKHETIYLSKRGDLNVGSDGAIYRHVISESKESFTLKVRKQERFSISEVGYEYLKSLSGKFKCELDITYDVNSPETISSCTYKVNGEAMLQDHLEFLRIMKHPFLGSTILRQATVKATKWKIKTDGFIKEPSVEMWKFANTCLLEVSAKFKGLDTALPTLQRLQELIPGFPSPKQGNKTNQVFATQQ